MANLLPEQEMRAMKGEFRDRFAMAGALMLLGTALLAGLMLLPSYLVLVAVEPADQSAVQRAKDNKQSLQDITRAQNLMKEMTTILHATTSPSIAIARVVALRPKGITMTSISYSMGSPAHIDLSGIGANRDVINAYRDALLKDPKFLSVSIPVSALVGSVEGGSFTAAINALY